MATCTMERPRAKLPSRSIELADGTPVDLHAIGADDAPALERFHPLSSSETTYLRYFKVHPELGVLHMRIPLDERCVARTLTHRSGSCTHSLRWVRRYGGAGR